MTDSEERERSHKRIRVDYFSRLPATAFVDVSTLQADYKTPWATLPDLATEEVKIAPEGRLQYPDLLITFRRAPPATLAKLRDSAANDEKGPRNRLLYDVLYPLPQELINIISDYDIMDIEMCLRPKAMQRLEANDAVIDVSHSRIVAEDPGDYFVDANAQRHVSSVDFSGSSSCSYPSPTWVPRVYQLKSVIECKDDEEKTAYVCMERKDTQQDMVCELTESKGLTRKWAFDVSDAATYKLFDANYLVRAETLHGSRYDTFVAQFLAVDMHRVYGSLDDPMTIKGPAYANNLQRIEAFCVAGPYLFGLFSNNRQDVLGPAVYDLSCSYHVWRSLPFAVCMRDFVRQNGLPGKRFQLVANDAYVVLISSLSNELYVIDAVTFVLRWSYKIPESDEKKPTHPLPCGFLDRHRVVVQVDDGKDYWHSVRQQLLLIDLKGGFIEDRISIQARWPRQANGVRVDRLFANKHLVIQEQVSSNVNLVQAIQLIA